MSGNFLKVQLVRSPIGRPERQAKVVAGLGLRRVRQEKILLDTPANRGMIAKVNHLVSWSPVKR